MFVPVFLNTLRGLRQVRPVHRDLHARVRGHPAAGDPRGHDPVRRCPHFFTGLRIASSLAVISALVAEYFGGPREGLGSAITTAAASSAYARAWAFVIGAILLGLVFFVLTTLLERIVVPPPMTITSAAQRRPASTPPAIGRLEVHHSTTPPREEECR